MEGAPDKDAKVPAETTLEKPQEVRDAERRLGARDTRLIQGITQGICDGLSPVLAELRKRLSELENRPTFNYTGVWDEKISYGVGSFATHQGGLWHCNRPTMDRPGTSPAWSLAVKRGKGA